MSLLTAAQINLLDKAVEIGILSQSEHLQFLKWHATELKHHNYSDDKRVTKPRPLYRTSEPAVIELEIRTILREIQIAEDEVDVPQKRRHSTKGLRKKLFALLEKLSALTGIKYVDPLSREPEGEEQLPGRPEMLSSARVALDCMEELQSLEANLCFVATPVVLRTNALLGNADAALCLRWNDIAFNARTTSEATAWTRLRELDTYRQCQVLSARSAELVMQAYYAKMGFDVEDVSLMQLEDTTDDWKVYDLRVGDRLIDVKNARKSLNGGGNFVEHCVPKFKELRATGDQVVIAGVLSDYQKDPNFYRQAYPSATVLGEVNVVEVRRLYLWAKYRFGPHLDLTGLWNYGFLPGWLFEYPDAYYPRRNETINSLSSIARRLNGAGLFSDRLPGWLLVLCGDEELVRSMPIKESKRKLILDLHLMVEKIGVSRRSLYVFVMGIALEALANRDSPEDDLTELISLIALPVKSPNGNEQLSMLGLADPMGYVVSLVKTLSKIGNKLLTLGIHLTGFRLVHPAILKGVCSDGRVLTLLAYCGGWQTVPISARCGTTPLTIIDDEHCPLCGHLVCHNCGHCSNICRSCKPRQLERARLISEAEQDRYADFDSEDYGD